MPPNEDGIPNQIPRRTYLDTSVLQTLHTYGEFIYENALLEPTNRIHRNPLGVANLEALQAIFRANARAQFEFVVSLGAVQEVARRNDLGYLRYALDIQQYSDDLIEELGAGPAPGLSGRLDSPSCGFLGAGDRQLLKEAVALGCDGFLTMENRLPKNAAFIQRLVSTQILSPAEFWGRVKPFAGLFS